MRYIGLLLSLAFLAIASPDFDTPDADLPNFTNLEVDAPSIDNADCYIDAVDGDLKLQAEHAFLMRDLGSPLPADGVMLPGELDKRPWTPRIDSTSEAMPNSNSMEHVADQDLASLYYDTDQAMDRVLRADQRLLDRTYVDLFVIST